VRRLLSSPRRRRRLIRLSILALLVTATALLGVFFRNTGRSFDTPLRNEPASVYVAPKSVPTSAAAIRAARATAYEFVRTAVRREDVADSWLITHPSLKAGYTKAQWAAGTIPVIPYPADLRLLRYTVAYSYENTLGLSVSVRAKRPATDHSMVFGIELTKVGQGARKHWLVSQWTPMGLSGNGQLSAGLGSGPAADPDQKGALSTIWLAVPALILAGIIAVPIAVLGGGWYRGRRAQRAYLAERGLQSRR